MGLYKADSREIECEYCEGAGAYLCLDKSGNNGFEAQCPNCFGLGKILPDDAEERRAP